MLCNFCDGIGEVLIDGRGTIVTSLSRAVMMVPCPAGCIGGISYCCSGDRACPEDDRAERERGDA